MSRPGAWVGVAAIVFLASFGVAAKSGAGYGRGIDPGASGDDAINAAAQKQIDEGRETFRFDTFGDEAFWGGQLQLHQAFEGAKLGGLGGGVSPATALAVGLKVDVDQLPKQVQQALRAGTINLNDPAVTLTLLK